MIEDQQNCGSKLLSKGMVVMLTGSDSEHMLQVYNCWKAAHFPFPGGELGQAQQLVASQVSPV